MKPLRSVLFLVAFLSIACSSFRGVRMPGLDL